jgi:hypothetical protein
VPPAESAKLAAAGADHHAWRTTLCAA